MNKRALEMSFAWMFSLIVGAIILFLAIYFATSLIRSDSYEINTKTAKRFSNMLDPLQTTTEESGASKFSIPIETRVYTSCDTYDDFGHSVIEISEKFGINKKWSKKGGDISKQNGYLFAEDVIEGKTFYYFVRPFNMPFKVADIIMMYSEAYCFVNAPEQIKGDAESFGQDKNMFTANSENNCPDDSISVCFGLGDCDVKVQSGDDTYETGFVKKTENGRDYEVYFVGDLIYPAIFSSKENYECGVNRLIMKLRYLSSIYSEKAQLMSNRCGTGVYQDVINLLNSAKDYVLKGKFSEGKLNTIKDFAEDVEETNKEAICRLY